MRISVLHLLLLVMLALHLRVDAAVTDGGDEELLDAKPVEEEEHDDSLPSNDDEEAMEATASHLVESLAKLFKGDDSNIPSFDSLTPDRFMVSSFVFPNSPIASVGRFVLGEHGKIVFGCENLWIAPIVIVEISGAIYSPDFSFQYQNLTALPQWTLLPPTETASIALPFSPSLEPLEYGLIVNIGFITKDQGETYTLQVFRDVIEILPPEESLFDFQSIYLYVLLISSVLAGAYFVRSTFERPKEAKSAAPVSDWIPKGHKAKAK